MEDTEEETKALIHDILSRLVHRNRMPGIPTIRGGLQVDTFYQHNFRKTTRSDFDAAIEQLVDSYPVEWTSFQTAIKITDRKEAKQEVKRLRKELWG